MLERFRPRTGCIFSPDVQSLPIRFGTERALTTTTTHAPSDAWFDPSHVACRTEANRTANVAIGWIITPIYVDNATM